MAALTNDDFRTILRRFLSKQTGASISSSASLPQHDLYLLDRLYRMKKTTFSSKNCAKNPYMRKRSASNQRKPPAKPHKYTVMQFQAFLHMKTYFPDLSQGFSINELKKAFRKGALQCHPDQGGSEHLFRKLMESYNKLIMVLEENKKQQS